MVLKARHNKHGACLSCFWYYSFFVAVGANIGRRLHIVRVHLSSKESFSEDLEERFLWRKVDIVLALGSIEAESTALATSKDDYTNFATPDKRVSFSLVDRFIVAWQVCGIDNTFWFDCIKDRFTFSFLLIMRLRICYKIAIELVYEFNVELRALIEKIFTFKGA